MSTIQQPRTETNERPKLRKRGMRVHQRQRLINYLLTINNQCAGCARGLVQAIPGQPRHERSAYLVNEQSLSCVDCVPAVRALVAEATEQLAIGSPDEIAERRRRAERQERKRQQIRDLMALDPLCVCCRRPIVIPRGGLHRGRDLMPRVMGTALKCSDCVSRPQGLVDTIATPPVCYSVFRHE